MFFVSERALLVSQPHVSVTAIYVTHLNIRSMPHLGTITTLLPAACLIFIVKLLFHHIVKPTKKKVMVAAAALSKGEEINTCSHACVSFQFKCKYTFKVHPSEDPGSICPGQ